MQKPYGKLTHHDLNIITIYKRRNKLRNATETRIFYPKSCVSTGAHAVSDAFLHSYDKKYNVKPLYQNYSNPSVSAVLCPQCVYLILKLQHNNNILCMHTFIL